MEGYTYNGPVECVLEPKLESLVGKTAVITGGASGLGEAYVRALVAAGVYVCFGDVNEKEGVKLATELKRAKYIKCDVTKWDDQGRLFREAISFSPSGKIDFVVANAGVARKDEVFSYAGKDQEPLEPDLSTIDINLKGTLYTVKLSLHYFVKQNGQDLSSQQEDTCLVLIGSGAAYLDCPRGPQYSSTKWGMRGIMHSMRRTAFYYGKSYVKTKILSQEAFEQVEDVGVQLATTEDAGRCLLHILTDKSINGRSLFVSARKWAPRGYLDLDLDDYPRNALLKEIQEDQVKSSPISAGLFVN